MDTLSHGMIKNVARTNELYKNVRKVWLILAERSILSKNDTSATI